MGTGTRINEYRVPMQVFNAFKKLEKELEAVKKDVAFYLQNNGHFAECNVFDQHIINPICRCDTKIKELLKGGK